MRFLHTADWHIGKKLHEFDLVDEQQDAYQQIAEIAKEEKVDAIVIAGDLYDRKVPSEESINQLDAMILDLNLTRKFPILAVSGNHDSAPRLGSGSHWYEATHFYLHTTIAQALTPIEMADTQFFLLPYFEPFQVRHFFEDDSIQNVQQAMNRLVAEMQKKFDSTKQHVLVAHFFAAGSQHVDSETTVEVGGLDAIAVDSMVAFDYVALGHLHGKDALHAEAVKYSGSPVKFSLSEAKQQKGVWIVDTAPYNAKFVPIKPKKDIEILTESFATLINPAYYEKVNRSNFIAISLTDVDVITDVMARLRKIYPYIINLDRKYGIQDVESQKRIDPNLDPMTLLTDFYNQATDSQMSKDQQKWAAQALTVAKEDDE